MLRCQERPQKKKKKKITHCGLARSSKEGDPRRLTLKLLTSALPRESAFKRYMKMADEMLERPEKMTIHVKNTCQDSR